MSDPIKRPLQIPTWQIPYLEKHRLIELFHEIGRELVIQQPTDHVLFLKRILLYAIKSRDSARVVILSSPKVNNLEVAKLIVEITKQSLITETSLQAYSGNAEITNPLVKAKVLSQLLIQENRQADGWIIVDCIKNEAEAKAIIKQGILPTHVLHFIPSFYPPFDELLYCHVSSEWPEYRRNILALRNCFKTTLKEIFLQERSLEEIVMEAVKILQIKPAKYELTPRVLILGPRGCGRKTQAKLIAHELNLIHIDFEQLICQTWTSYSDLGEKLRTCKNEVCLHSELLSEVIQKRVLEKDCLARGWVLTGFPFSRKDFEFLDCIYTPPNRVIFLECELSICKERIWNRKVNIQTGSVTDVKEPNENFKMHPKDDKDYIDAELSYYCENYGDLKKYCGSGANYINGNQSERWVFESILALIIQAPPVYFPRKPFLNSPSTISSDSCCCSPNLIQNIL